jgi:hypothetical protein
MAEMLPASMAICLVQRGKGTGAGKACSQVRLLVA